MTRRMDKMKKWIIAIMMLTLLLCSCFAAYAEASILRASELIVSCSCGISANGTALMIIAWSS